MILALRRKSFLLFCLLFIICISIPGPMFMSHLPQAAQKQRVFNYLKPFSHGNYTLFFHFQKRCLNVDHLQSVPWLVSEALSAGQLWFRNSLLLIQHYYLPEHLWTALIQLWTDMITKNFRAENNSRSRSDLWRKENDIFLSIFTIFPT